jgi:hypothetical protein
MRNVDAAARRAESVGASAIRRAALSRAANSSA